MESDITSQKEYIDKQFDQSQQQIDNDPNAIYADTMREEKTSNLLNQINPDNLLTDIEHRIRGEKKDPYTHEWVKNEHAKPVSEKLISNFVSFLGAILNQNTAMSNFSVDEINNMMQMIIKFVSIDLTLNDKEYGIEEDYSEMWRISNIICITCFATFKQAMNGSLSRRVFGSLKVAANLNDNQTGGIKDALMFWK